MNRLFSVLLVGSTLGCPSTVNDSRGVGLFDAGLNEAAAVSPDHAEEPDASFEGCESAVDVAREGDSLRDGHRVALDLRRARRLRVPGVGDDPRPTAFLSVVAPQEGVLAVYVASQGQSSTTATILRVATCDPLRAFPSAVGLAPPSMLFGGFGQRYRVRRGESLRIAVSNTVPVSVLVVTLRMMPTQPAGGRCDPANQACGVGLVCATERDGLRCIPGGRVSGPCSDVDPPCEAGSRCVVELSLGSGLTGDQRFGICRWVVSPGARCSGYDSCEGGLECARSSVDGVARCVARGREGTRCGRSSECAEGLFCPSRWCVPRRLPGEACDDACDDGLECRPAPGGERRCRPPGELGGYCREVGPACAPDLRCDRNNARCAIPLAPGDRCGSTIFGACQGGRCVAGRCEVAGGPGQACSSELPACAEGFVCGAGDRCVRALAVGERCTEDHREGRCESGECVDGTCRARSGREGEPCAAIDRCEPGLSCIARRCVPHLALGASCVHGVTAACGEGLICYGEPSSRRCLRVEPLRCDPRGACDEGRSCIDGECVTDGACDRAPSLDHPRVPCGAQRACVFSHDAYQCVQDGTEGGLCRRPDDACADGLLCAPSGRCRRVAQVGEECAPGLDDVCAPGSLCVVGPAGPRCVADGGALARCRRPMTRADACDAELACDTGRGLCMPVTGRCDEPGRPTVQCPAGQACGLPTTRGCVALGSLGGLCRELGAPCDEGLTCMSGSRCLRALGEGAICDGATVDGLCAEELRCVRGRCVRQGSLGAPCVETNAPWLRCQQGLACVDGRCQIGVLEGGNCDDSDATKRCAAAFECVAEGNAHRCRPRGGEGRECLFNVCASALVCHGDRCVREVEVGGACGEVGTTGPACVTGACVGGRCAVPGGDGAPCRVGRTCDTGLRCASATSDGRGVRCVLASAAPINCAGPESARCAGASSCVESMPGASRCVDDGAEGGLCRVIGAPRCASGLRCDPVTARCVR